jgi:hypothetical protein
MVGDHGQNICDQFSALPRWLLFMVFIQLEKEEQLGLVVLTMIVITMHIYQKYQIQWPKFCITFFASLNTIIQLVLASLLEK